MLYTYNALRFGAEASFLKDVSGFDVLNSFPENNIKKIKYPKDCVSFYIEEDSATIPEKICEGNTLFSYLLSFGISDVAQSEELRQKTFLQKIYKKLFYSFIIISAFISFYFKAALILFPILFLLFFYIQFAYYRDLKMSFLSTFENLCEEQVITEIERDIGKDYAKGFAMLQAFWIFSPMFKLYKGKNR